MANANRFAEESEDEDVRDEPMRQNNYPLLVAVNQSGRMGSLVPLGAATSRLIPLQTAPRAAMTRADKTGRSP